MFKMTKWTKHVTDNGEDRRVVASKLEGSFKKKGLNYKFRLLDDDGNVQGYGYSDDNDSEKAFDPLDYYEERYGCTEIEYFENGVWERL